MIIALTSLLWGCGKANDAMVTVDPSGKHPTTWRVSHGTSFLQDGTTCRGCHGAALGGGISGVSCSSATFNGLSCHANGPHPLPWPDHNKATNQLNSCSPCHGVALTGGATAPACAKCHINLPPGSVPVLGVCTSCHGNPPDGSIFPNLSGSHRAHTQIPLFCAVCHDGGGSGTATHGKTLTVAFPAAYNAKSGIAVRNADGTCSNISCHGGKTTKFWRGGRVDPLKDCQFCHDAGSAQYNSYNSGEHQKHLLEIGLLCVDCHDMTAVSGGKSHFSGLSTPAFELPPQSTLRAPLNFNSGSCTPNAGSFSIGVCHATKNW